jgi:hypothetical protein
VPLSSLRRSVGRRLRALIGAYSRLTLESEGVDESRCALRSPALAGRVAVPGSEPASRDLDHHQPDVRGDHHDDHDGE